MTIVVMAKVVSTAELENNDTPFSDAPLVTTKSTVIPPFGCKWVKGLVESPPVHSC